MTLTWEAVAALTVLAVAVIGAHIKVMQMLLKAELARAMDELASRYVRTEWCDERHENCRRELLRRLDRVDADGQR